MGGDGELAAFDKPVCSMAGLEHACHWQAPAILLLVVVKGQLGPLCRNEHS